MSSRRRWTLLAAPSVLAVSLTLAALAWACIPSASMNLSPTTGPPGTSVAVTGSGFPSGAAVHISWNGGQPLATTAADQAGAIQTTITIPSAPADVYTISASAGGARGPSSAFTIPGPAASPPDGSSSPAQSRQTGGPASSPGGPHTTSGTASGGDGVAGRATGESAVTGADGHGGNDTGSAGGVTTLASGTPVFADSLTSAALRAADAGRGSDPSAGSRGAVSEASVASDLWSGFGARAGDEFLDGGADAAEGSGRLPALSLTLLALGIVSAVAGAGLAAVRGRRRARARGGAASG